MHEKVPLGAHLIDPFSQCVEANYPYAIKNQRGVSKIPAVGGILRSILRTNNQGQPRQEDP